MKEISLENVNDDDDQVDDKNEKLTIQFHSINYVLGDYNFTCDSCILEYRKATEANIDRWPGKQLLLKFQKVIRNYLQYKHILEKNM